MRSKLGILLMLTMVGCGEIVSAQAEFGEGWTYLLPETGIMPSHARLTALTRMGERHGGSHLSMQKYALTLPFSDPRRSGGDGWLLNVELEAEWTRIQTGGTLTLAHDDFYRLMAPISFIRPKQNGDRLILSLAPAVAADSGSFAEGWDVAAAAVYTFRCSETLNCGVGMYVSPRFASYGVFPLLSFEWKPTQDWTVSLKNYHLTAMKALPGGFEVGPFLGGSGGIWAVETPRGDRFFRVRSLVAGVTAVYDFSRPGQTKRIVEFSLGSTLATTAGFCRRNGSKENESLHHYKPGLYLSAGVDFRF